MSEALKQPPQTVRGLDAQNPNSAKRAMCYHGDIERVCEGCSGHSESVSRYWMATRDWIAA